MASQPIPSGPRAEPARDAARGATGAGAAPRPGRPPVQPAAPPPAPTATAAGPTAASAIDVAERVDAEDEQRRQGGRARAAGPDGHRGRRDGGRQPVLGPAQPEDPPTIFLDVLGRDLGMLIGRRGDNLAQLQYLVNLLVNRRIGDWTRVIVDVEGYRSRREESLIGLAERVARQVVAHAGGRSSSSRCRRTSAGSST